MSEIEFLEEPLSMASSSMPPAWFARLSAWTLVMWASWAAAAGLLVAAAFQVLFGERIDNLTAASRIVVDGWGRRPGGVGGHGPRYGIIFCAVAACMLAALATTAWQTLATRSRSRPILSQLLAVAAASTLVGVAGALGVQYDSLASDAAAATSSVNVTAESPGSSLAFHTYFGPGSLLLLGALALTLVATVILLIRDHFGHQPTLKSD